MHSHLLHYVIKLNGPGPNTTLGYSHFYSPSPLIPLTLLVAFRYYYCRYRRRRLLSTHRGALSEAIPASLSQWALTLHQWPRKLSTVIAESLASWQLDSTAFGGIFRELAESEIINHGDTNGQNFRQTLYSRNYILYLSFTCTCLLYLSNYNAIRTSLHIAS